MPPEVPSEFPVFRKTVPLSEYFAIPDDIDKFPEFPPESPSALCTSTEPLMSEELIPLSSSRLPPTEVRLIPPTIRT
jgi:hypothetical protein